MNGTAFCTRQFPSDVSLSRPNLGLVPVTRLPARVPSLVERIYSTFLGIGSTGTYSGTGVSFGGGV